MDIWVGPLLLRGLGSTNHSTGAAGKTAQAGEFKPSVTISHTGESMINVSSIYPKKDGCEFDFDYYLNKHMPRSIELLSAAKGFRGVSVERGMDIDEPKLESSYVAMCHYYFDSLEDFMAAFVPHAEELQGDIANYTNIEPTIQINEVQIAR